ncbi:bacterioferritin [Thiotrichales bacterium 19S3-7]|nr:bacterioferritin [Thiotrichales bacterium 19S3-7]MCF6800603.1 bacterioferritin [Thiotrichales bacterium 19S3-11]
MKLQNCDQTQIMHVLNRILELEMAGVVRYTHYSFMVYGHSRIPITKWLAEQAQESLLHATRVGELITHFEGHPSLKIGELLETHQHDINSILEESLTHEKEGLELYYQLLELTKDRCVTLEEFAREMITEEENHMGEVEKMMRKP